MKNKSGGLFVISTLTGFIVYAKEYTHREIPKEVSMDVVEAFTKKDSNINYFERMEALGYDNMCSLLKTVYKSLRDGKLSELEEFFWNEMGVRAFVDNWHMKNHRCELCSKDHEYTAECLNSKLPKFKKIFRHDKQYKEKKKQRDTLINDEVMFNFHKNKKTI